MPSKREFAATRRNAQKRTRHVRSRAWTDPSWTKGPHPDEEWGPADFAITEHVLPVMAAAADRLDNLRVEFHARLAPIRKLAFVSFQFGDGLEYRAYACGDHVVVAIFFGENEPMKPIFATEKMTKKEMAKVIQHLLQYQGCTAGRK